jgi:predicted amidohydrolase YtcJ
MLSDHLRKKRTRRQFLAISGATLAGILVSGCNRLRQKNALPTEISESGQPVKPTEPAQIKATPITPQPSQPPQSVDQTADILMTNAKVLTIDPANRITEAIAIKNGLIQAVGTNDAIAALRGDNSQVMDMGGRTISPGLIDPHNHFRLIGLQYTYFTGMLPPEVKDIASLQRQLAEVIKTKKPGEWVIAYFLVLTDNMYPGKAELDPVSPNNPVFIMHIGGHWGGSNSYAMRLAGIDANSESPTGGVIAMDSSGQPTGVFYNHRAMDLVRKNAPPILYDEVLKSILDTQKLMLACGVTTFHDNNIRDVEHIRAYQQLARDGSLFMRHSLFLTLEWPTDMERVDQVDYFSDSITRVAGYKFLIDGQIPTAFCHEPHNGITWNLSTWDEPTYKSAIRSLHDTGLQISVHCFGDAAVDMTLSAFEDAMNANPRADPRHRLEHVLLTKPQSTTKMKDLGVVVSTNPQFIYVGGDSYAEIFGSERVSRILVTREWIDAGVHVTIGSDAPTTPFYSPQSTMAGAISRLTFSKKVIGPDQIMTFEEALRAHTIEGAYAAHEENIKGSIEAGKLADLAVWNQDPSTLSIGELFNLPSVYMTIIGGKVVYQM